MAITGIVYQQADTVLASVRITDLPDYRLIEVIIGSDVVIKFPMIKTVDTNEIALRVANVVNQTGFISKPVRCEVIAS